MFIDLVKKRQSARHYLPRLVEIQLIDKCLEAARLAPSACNSQPWHFIVVNEPTTKNTLCENVFSGPYAMNSFAKEAPVIIAVITEKSTFMAKIGGTFRGTQYALVDIGIAVEHFILQATEEGLASCWIGWFDEKRAKKILGVTPDKKIDCLISLGYTQEPLREKNRKSTDEIRSLNRYRS